MGLKSFRGFRCQKLWDNRNLLSETEPLEINIQGKFEKLCKTSELYIVSRTWNWLLYTVININNHNYFCTVFSYFLLQVLEKKHITY